LCLVFFFFFSSRRRHTRSKRDWSSDVCSSDLGRLAGAGLAGLAVVADREITGLALAGYRVESPRVAGLNIAGLYLKTRELEGLSLSAYNRVRGLQRGVAIGIYNSAYVLKGVQLGVLNRAKNNRGIFRILPVLNAHL